MSFSQVNITKAAHLNKNFRLNKKPNFGNEPMHISRLPITGIATTFAADRYITESAAAGTALATGKKTSCGTIAMAPDHTQNYKTIAEMARDKGMKVGIVSSVSIDHATPACFYAHHSDRGKYTDISLQMAATDFDFFGGGFAKGHDSSSESKNIIKKMKEHGYKVVTSKAELQKTSPGEKCWAYNTNLADGAALQYEIDQSEDYFRLADFTAEGIRLLHNEKGFFIMIESGKIDWACHANDAVTASYEVIALDEAVGEALKFYNQHPDETLIIVTGDHETGGLTLGYAATKYESIFDILNFQKISFENFSLKVNQWKESPYISQPAVMDSIQYYFGLNDVSKSEKLVLNNFEMKKIADAYQATFNPDTEKDAHETYILYGGYDPLTVTITHILNQKAGVDWASYSHTGLPVPIYAIGAGQENFVGQLDNTDIPNKIIQIAKLN
ncbi:MAG: alkaline phosphatase [Candidatus Marinimicrobia bacterium]|nr:alkaline phosphatase [Candidatus Neomarinimicrobiota bacterium]